MKYFFWINIRLNKQFPHFKGKIEGGIFFVRRLQPNMVSKCYHNMFLEIMKNWSFRRNSLLINRVLSSFFDLVASGRTFLCGDGRGLFELLVQSRLIKRKF